MDSEPTRQQWIESLRQDTWIEIDASASLIKKVEAAVAGLATGAKGEAKSKLAPVTALQKIRSFPVAPIHLIHALAKVSTPVVPNLAAFSASWAERRYIWAFNPSRSGARPLLRLSKYARRLDFHQKTLLSDDLGVAVASYVMETFFPVEDIANATTAVESKIKGAYRTGKKWPDLVCADSSGMRAYVVECKGSGSGWHEVRRQLTQGIRQVTAVGFGRGTQTERFVLATQFRKDSFLLHAIDPPERDDHAVGSNPGVRPDEIKLAIAEVRLLSAARTLAFCGDYGAAIRLLHSSLLKPYPRIQPPAFEPEVVTIDEVEAIGRRDHWETPSGVKMEVFRGLSRNVHAALVGADQEAIMAGVNTPRRKVASNLHPYHLCNGAEERTESVTSMGCDGTMLQVRMKSR